jgi:hypothetical protein
VAVIPLKARAGIAALTFAAMAAAVEPVNAVSSSYDITSETTGVPGVVNYTITIDEGDFEAGTITFTDPAKNGLLNNVIANIINQSNLQAVRRTY